MGNAYKLQLLCLLPRPRKKNQINLNGCDREEKNRKKERINRMKLFEPHQKNGEREREKKNKSTVEIPYVCIWFSAYTNTETFSCLLSSHMYNMSYILTLSFVLTDYVKLVRLLNFSSFAFKLTQSKMYGIQFICKTVENNISSANMGNEESNRFKLVFFFLFHSACLL